jgi:hypothetical protein
MIVPVPRAQSLGQALEQLTYLALERHHPGWEINDGACGELVIDVAEATFVLDCSCASPRPMITRPSSRRPGMAHCYYHALSSVRKWGGTVDDYLPLHQWFDQSKAILADPRHRALRHHAEGIFMLETCSARPSSMPMAGSFRCVWSASSTYAKTWARSPPLRIGRAHHAAGLDAARGNPLDGAEGVTIDMPALRRSSFVQECATCWRSGRYEIEIGVLRWKAAGRMIRPDRRETRQGKPVQGIQLHPASMQTCP